MYTVVAVRGAGQSGVFLQEVFTATQRHITHQQQPRAVSYTGLGVFHTSALTQSRNLLTGSSLQVSCNWSIYKSVILKE